MSNRAWDWRRSKGLKLRVLYEHPCGCSGYKLGMEKVRTPCWEHTPADVRARATAADESYLRSKQVGYCPEALNHWPLTVGPTADGQTWRECSYCGQRLSTPTKEDDCG